jgi:uncharacterized protein YoxC
MPKAAMTIAGLEQLLEKQKSLLKDLQKKREGLVADIVRVNKQIASLMGSAAAALKRLAQPRRKLARAYGSTS